MSFRHTPQRQLVLLAVKASRQFLSANSVWRVVRRQLPGIGLATVYRNLELLASRGEIFAFNDDRAVRRYAGFVFFDSGFTCEQCGRELPVALRRYQEQITRALRGQTIFFSRLEVRGLCRRCSQRVGAHGRKVMA